MTLVNRFVPLKEDTIRPTDLLPHSSSIASCPFCGKACENHATEEDIPEHDHREFDNINICRKLYECDDNSFYSYTNLDEIKKWVIVKIPTSSIETVDDSEVLKYGKIGNREYLKPVWRFNTSLASKEDWTEYFNKNLIVGLELELDWSKGEMPNSTISKTYGVPPTSYHSLPNCSICGSGGCWEHIPKNLIRAVEHDSSINGWEFIIYGSNMSSEEFASKLPLEQLKRYFKPTQADGLHIHLLLVHDIKPIPVIVAKNLWQLFRFYYPAWIYLFGNYSVSQGFIRNSGHGHDYTTYSKFSTSPFKPTWGKVLRNKDIARNGLWFGPTQIDQENIGTFDIEIRTPDSTLDLEQLVASRAISKALVLRSAQLSNYGLLSVETNVELWSKIKTTIKKINSRITTDDDEKFMRENAQAFLKELLPFLSEFERKCIRNLIETPVRRRAENTSAVIIPKTSELAKELKKLMSLAQIEVESKEEWIMKVARLMNKTNEEIEKALMQIKAWYDSDSKTMLFNP